MNIPGGLKLKINWFDIATITIGGLLYAVAFDFFLSPNSFTPGGVTGISATVNRLLDAVPVGMLIIALNVPIFIFGLKIEGHNFIIKSLIGMVVSSVAIDLLDGVYAYTDDMMLAALFGGVLMGAGLGLIFSRGGTTGGSDIIARLLNNRLPGLSVGRLILVVDAIIITVSALVFGNITFALYSVVGVYVSSIVIDSITYGAESARVVFIITQKTDEVVDAIARELDRGATLLSGVGTYTKEPKSVIMCAIKRRQLGALKQLVRIIDPASFVILMDAHEVLGDGFMRHVKEK